MAENKQQQQLKAITEKLEKGIADLFNSKNYMEYLKTMSKFHNYSFSNTLLIALQKPDATFVAGYEAWQRNFGRHVMKDEKSIKIIAPMPYKVQEERQARDPDTGTLVYDEMGEPVMETVMTNRPRFKVASVFDVSQTDGKPLPELRVEDLSGSVEGYEMFSEALKRTSKVPIGFEDIPGSSHGYYHQVDKRIALKEGMSQVQTVKTLIHEIAHSRLHDADAIEAGKGMKVNQRTKEVQAESVAYAVCQYFKLDTSEYSFGYIAGWSSGKEMKELKSSLETIQREANSMITEISGHIKELQKEREEKELETENAFPDEAVFKVSGIYFHMQRASDDSWDYTFYDRNFRELDGGRIGDGAMQFEEAKTEILETCHISNNGEILQYTTEQFEQMAQEHEDGLKTPMYLFNFQEARDRGEVEAWRHSKNATEECAEQFSKEFGLFYHDRRMPEFLQMMADRYGMERCKVVLASTIQLAEHDGRYYPSTKEEAAKVVIPGADKTNQYRDTRLSYYTNCHPVMVNAAFRELCQMEKEQMQETTKASVMADRPAGRQSVLRRLEEKKHIVDASQKQPAAMPGRKKGVEIGCSI